jgi:hypothetical protein
MYGYFQIYFTVLSHFLINAQNNLPGVALEISLLSPQEEQ